MALSLVFLDTYLIVNLGIILRIILRILFLISKCHVSTIPSVNIILLSKKKFRLILTKIFSETFFATFLPSLFYCRFFTVAFEIPTVLFLLNILFFQLRTFFYLGCYLGCYLRCHLGCT